MYQTDGSPQPATPILGDTDGFTDDPDHQRKLWLKIYHAVLKSVAIIAGLAMMLVQTGILPVGDKEAQGNWVEIASQVVNGVFMWEALTSHPYYVVRLIMASRVLKASVEPVGKKMGPAIRAARYLHTQFPLLVVHRSILYQEPDYCEAQVKCKASSAVSRLGNFLFILSEVKYLRNALVMLNCSCLFQYLMTAYLWSYGPTTRPAFVMPALLPPTLLCNAIGQHCLKKLRKRGENRRMVLENDVPVFHELSTTRHSESSD